MTTDLPSFDPFRFCSERGIVSFSGGRTSAYLLWRILQAFGGGLPDHVKVLFSNTGREMPETLDFVQECSERWSVPVTWLEYRPGGWEVVTHATASRDGLPFKLLVETPLKRRDGTTGVRPLPNPVGKSCTKELKIRLQHRYIRRVLGWSAYTTAVGIRLDEANRASGKFAEPGQTLAYPLVRAGVAKFEILRWWWDQPFNLALPVDKHGDTIEGNCDLCFMKSAKKISALVKKYPERGRWWADLELAQAKTDRPTVFRQDRPNYSDLLAAVERGEAKDYGIFDDMTTCQSFGCTD